MTARSLLPTLALCGLAQAAFSQPSQADIVRNSPVAAVPPIFRKAVASVDHLKYAGTRTVEVRRGADRITHIEYIVHDGLRSRVWFPANSTFAGQVIVEDGRERLHYYPKRNAIEVLPPKQQDAFLRLRNWVRHPGVGIKLAATGGGLVAGRPTELAEVFDAKGNIRQRMWIDVATGMILKREVLDAVGGRTGYFEFTQVDYSPVIIPSDFTINVRGARLVTLQDKLRDLALRNRMLDASIPASTGFQLQSVNMMRVMDLRVLHEAYSGKHGQLSLFEVEGNINMEGLRPQNQRGIDIYGWQMGGHSFALVGTYPLSELKELAQLLGEPQN